MAIAFDNSAQFGQGSGAGPVTTSFTCTGSDRFLVVVVEDDTGGSRLTTGVTYNGVAMTLVPNSSYFGTQRWQSTWYLANPASGSNTISITLSSGSFVQALASSYTGVSSAGLDSGGVLNNNVSATSLTTTTTTVANNCWLIGSSVIAGGGTITGGTGTLKRVEGASFDSGVKIFDSDGARTPAGSQALVASGTTNWTYAYLLVFSIAPATAPVVANTGNMFFAFK